MIMATIDNFAYPYDDSFETWPLLLSRCCMYDFLVFDGRVYNGHLSIIHFNTRCALHEMNELCMWLSSLQINPNEICLTGTWYTKNTLPYQIQGYKVFNVPIKANR